MEWFLYDRDLCYERVKSSSCKYVLEMKYKSYNQIHKLKAKLESLSLNLVR